MSLQLSRNTRSATFQVVLSTFENVYVKFANIGISNCAEIFMEHAVCESLQYV